MQWDRTTRCVRRCSRTAAEVACRRTALTNMSVSHVTRQARRGSVPLVASISGKLTRSDQTKPVIVFRADPHTPAASSCAHRAKLQEWAGNDRGTDRSWLWVWSGCIWDQRSWISEISRDVRTDERLRRQIRIHGTSRTQHHEFANAVPGKKQGGGGGSQTGKREDGPKRWEKEVVFTQDKRAVRLHRQPGERKVRHFRRSLSP